MKHTWLRKFFAMMLVTAFGCCNACGAKKITFPESGPFVVYTQQAAYGRIDELYKEVYTIQADGHCLITAEVEQEEAAGPSALPRIDRVVDSASLKELKDRINQADFMSLPSNVSTESADGAYYSISVTDNTHTHCVSGLNPDNKRFISLRDFLQNNLLKEAAAELREAMKKYYDAGQP